MTQYFGKYRGTVINNNDPLQLARLTITVPAVSARPLGWAMPCVPYAGDGVGFFALPPIGANVWVEFEGGDPDYPIWTGCFWSTGQLPADPALPTTKVLKTETTTFAIDDSAGTVSLEIQTAQGPVKIAQEAAGIHLSIGETNLTLSLQGLDLTSPPSSVSLRPQGIKMQNAAASFSLAPANISLLNQSTTINLSPAAIEINNGAASVALTPVSVSLNDGALEVM